MSMYSFVVSLLMAVACFAYENLFQKLHVPSTLMSQDILFITLVLHRDIWLSCGQTAGYFWHQILFKKILHAVLASQQFGICVSA